MIEPIIPHQEEARIKALESYKILDTLAEKEFDEITLLASEICKVPISLISLVDGDRQWFKSKVGLNAEETSRQISFCGHAINSPGEILIVPDARLDERFFDNPLVIGSPDIVFYAGVPLVDDAGFALGTLCAIDTEPNSLTVNQQAGLKVLANQIISLLSLRKKRMELDASVEMLKESINFSSPYFLWLSRENLIKEFGDNFKKSIPGFQKGKSFDDYFVWDKKFEIDEFLSGTIKYNKLLFFQTKDNLQRYKCSLKKYGDNAVIIFATAVINTKFLLANYHLNLNDFPQHDYIAEYLFLQQASQKGLLESKKLTEIVTEKNKQLEISKNLLINANSVLEKRVQDRTIKMKKLALFPEHNPNPILELDFENSNILYSNKAAQVLLKDLIKMQFDELINELGVKEKKLKNKNEFFFEFNFKNNFYSAKTYHLIDSEVVRIYFNNITDIKLAQQKEKEKNQQFILHQKILLDLRSLSSRFTFDEKIKYIIKQTAKVLGSDRCSFWNFENTQGLSITTKYIFNAQNETWLDGISLYESDFPNYFNAIKTKTEILATDACNHIATKEFKDVYLNKLGIVSMIDVPVKQAEFALGVICCEYFNTKDFSESEIAFTKSVSDAIMLAHEADQLKSSKLVLEEKSSTLEVAMANLLKSQNELLNKEKLATLGLLIAGIAHEINTPLGAIKASNENIKYSIDSDILSKIQTYEATEIKLGFELFSLYKKPNLILSTREERAIVQSIERELLKLNENQPSLINYSRKILELGYHHIDDRLLFYINHPKSNEIFSLAIYFVKIVAASNTIEVAVNKATKVLKALSTFSHGNPNNETIPFDLRENIDSAITILWNKIKHGSKIINEIKGDFIIHGNPEELAQIWTNIINNALQASDNKCTIKITCDCNTDYHVILISNDGPMIPPENLPYIFDAFFTTKKRGEGTGLGLNIIKNIIEKHQGFISCKSDEKETTFYINIPVNKNI